MDSSNTSEIEEAALPSTIPTVSEVVAAPTSLEEQNQPSDDEQPLKVLRTWRRFSQQTLAKAMGTSQGEISRIEKRKDMHVSTLRSYIRAIGGEVIILAKFPDNEVVQVTI